jgi:hypothetical protein
VTVFSLPVIGLKIIGRYRFNMAGEYALKCGIMAGEYALKCGIMAGEYAPEKIMAGEYALVTFLEWFYGGRVCVDNLRRGIKKYFVNGF